MYCFSGAEEEEPDRVRFFPPRSGSFLVLASRVS
jgi:hypothetical protein